MRRPYTLISVRDSDRRRVHIRPHRFCTAALEPAYHEAEPVAGFTPDRSITYMTEEDVRAIWQFVRENQGRYTDIIVHCEQGMSRSPAVAAALAEGLGINGTNSGDAISRTSTYSIIRSGQLQGTSMMNSDSKDRPLPGAEEIDALLAFLPILEQPGFQFAEHCGGEKNADGTIQMPYMMLTEPASRFVKALYIHNFIQPFRWSQWQDEAQRYLGDPSLIEQADLETICRLFTTHVRKDRFCDGHLEDMFECGHFMGLLRRLR